MTTMSCLGLITSFIRLCDPEICLFIRNLGRRVEVSEPLLINSQTYTYEENTS